MEYSDVTIIIVNWKSTVQLVQCIGALELQSLSISEIVVINAESTDNLDDILIQRHLNLKIIVKDLDFNTGFAAANNMGARMANGKWLALLNADAFPKPDWLEKLLKAAEAKPEYSFFSSKQIQANTPELLDGAGDAYHISGLAWRNLYNFSSEKYGYEQKEVFSACAAAALISRQEFLEAGGFDEDFFSYFEDVDLGFRLRLAGKKCLYVPDAVVHHVGSASTGKGSDFSVYYGYRNLIWTFFKNMPSPYLWIFLPLHAVTLVFFVVYLSSRGQGFVILKSIYDALRGLPGVLQKRKEIQGKKKIRSSELLHVMSINLFEPFREFIARRRSR